MSTAKIASENVLNRSGVAACRTPAPVIPLACAVFTGRSGKDLFIAHTRQADRDITITPEVSRHRHWTRVSIDGTEADAGAVRLLDRRRSGLAVVELAVAWGRDL